MKMKEYIRKRKKANKILLLYGGKIFSQIVVVSL